MSQEAPVSTRRVPRPNGKTVAVLGGGVAGLSAAHELARRGYAVTVYDARGCVGGKAASQYVKGTGSGGRGDLPGEHGFRFYPAFYKHLIRTMEEIPLDLRNGAGRKVADNLLAATDAGVAPADGGGVRRFLRRRPESYTDVAGTMQLYLQDLDVPTRDAVRFTVKVLKYFCSCRERRDQQYESISWWDFIGGADYTPHFQKYLRAVPRIMVAMDPRSGSARTIGNISMQLLQDYATEGNHQDRTLMGPTTEAWIGPWRAYLESLGVEFRLDRALRGFYFDRAAGRIRGARVEGEPEPVRADHFVLAVPLEVAVSVIDDEMAGFDREIEKLKRVRDLGRADSSTIVPPENDKMTDWMVGIQFYLKEDVPLVPGHIFLPDSPWALSAISQEQFWARAENGRFRARFGDGSMGGVLSVDISDWNSEGTFIKKPAKRCSPEEIKTEVWEQVKAGVNRRDVPALRDDLLGAWHLDDEIQFRAGAPRNHAPLLVHPPDSWSLRPTAELRIENLVLASDYVQTETILACMEGANEAARRAVNAILARDHDAGPRCELWPMVEAPIFDRAKRADHFLFSHKVRKPGQEPLDELWSEEPGPDATFDDVRRLQAQIEQLPV